MTDFNPTLGEEIVREAKRLRKLMPFLPGFAARQVGKILRAQPPSLGKPMFLHFLDLSQVGGIERMLKRWCGRKMLPDIHRP